MLAIPMYCPELMAASGRSDSLPSHERSPAASRVRRASQRTAQGLKAPSVCGMRRPCLATSRRCSPIESVKSSDWLTRRVGGVPGSTIFSMLDSMEWAAAEQG